MKRAGDRWERVKREYIILTNIKNEASPADFKTEVTMMKLC